MEICETKYMKVTYLGESGNEFFPTMNFKVEIPFEEPRFDTVSSIDELKMFMHIKTSENIAKAYYDLII